MLLGILLASTPARASSLSLTIVPGTADCGSAAPPWSPTGGAPPFSGELDSDTAGTTKLYDLGLGCLYLGGGRGIAIGPGKIPAGPTSYIDVSGTNLVASAGTGTLDCSRGAGPSKVCLNVDSLPACTSDADCGSQPGACHETANCFFGPPIEFPNPVVTGVTTCVLNVVQSDATGTGDPATGAFSATVPLASEVYVTGNVGQPCPHCCIPPPGGNCAGTCSYGSKAGTTCTTTSSSGTSQDCPPSRGTGAFQAPLAVTLNPLTTADSTLTAANGEFCPSQTAGAFGYPGARRIRETGSPAGDLTDGLPHAARLGSAFCIPKTGNATVDLVVDLPGPGAISLNTSARLVHPRVVCVNSTPAVGGPLIVRDVCLATEDTVGRFDALKKLLAATPGP